MNTYTREIERVWRCSKGHEIVHYKNEVNIGIAGIVMPSSEKLLCPWCYSEWVEANVPEMKEEI